MGTAVVFGMGIATVIGVFIIPACYVFVMRLNGSGKKKPTAEQPPGPSDLPQGETPTHG